jgi:tetratricopeptide (TPR) repeat protein/TolB-like protein
MAVAVLGDSIGPYQIVEKLGSGGMGEVFLCHDSRLQRHVALKRLTKGEPDSDEAAILREARAAARLTHPNIASVYDVLDHEGRAFIVMEYVEGESLRSRLLRGSLSPDEAIAVGIQLAAALGAAHAQGVIHRDLKPSNVQVMPAGIVKVLDFGVAKLIPRVETKTEAETTRRTEGDRAGSMGTPVYMAPEQLISGRTDARSDIYSIGVMLFEMVTGRRPFVETDAVALAAAMSGSPPPPPDAIDPRVPRGLASVIVKCLQREPIERFQSAGELAAALGELSDVTTREVIRLAAGRRSPRPLVIAASALAVTLLAGTVMWFAQSRGAAPTSASLLAILPVDNPTHDGQAEQIAAAAMRTVRRNLGRVSGLSVVPAPTTGGQQAADATDAIRRQLKADYLVAATVKSPPPRFELVVRFWDGVGNAQPSEETVSGDALTVQRTLIGRLIPRLERSNAWKRRLNDDERRQLTELPTLNAEALTLLVEGRAILSQINSTAEAARAADVFERATRVDPKFAPAHAALADAYLEQYRASRSADLVAKANAAALQAVQTDSTDSSAHAALAGARLAAGSYEDAIASIRRALQLDPADDASHRLLATIQADRGDIEGAIRTLREAVRIRPDYWRTYTALGRVYYMSGRFPESLDAYRRASELQPNDPGAWSGMGLIYQVLGNLPQAIGSYEHAVRLGASATAYSNLGLVYYSADRYKDAIVAWQEALRINPQSMLYHRNIGDAYRRLKQPAAAAAAYRSAIAIGETQLKVNRRDAETIAHVAVCEAKIGMASAADRHASEALVLAPENRVVLQRRAEVNALLNRPADALNSLRAAIEHGYGRRQARDNDEFASLRSLPAFQALVADLPSAGAKER